MFDLCRTFRKNCKFELKLRAAADDDGKFFTADAWLLVEQSMECMKKSRRYVCEVCFRDLDEQESIACDLCFKWAHLACVGLTKSPKRKYWYCRKCHQ